jgi:cytochrome P450
MSFHVGSETLETVQDLLSSDEAIGIRIDGSHVQDPQGPKGLPVVGNFYEVYPDHLGNHTRLFQQYGSVIKTTNMGKTTYLTNSPEVTAHVYSESQYFTKHINSSHPLWGIKDNAAIFVCDTENENFRLAHKFLTPALSPKAVRRYALLMQETVRESFSIFDEMDKRDMSWNVYQYMVKLASQTVGKFTLNLDLGHFESIDAPTHPIVTGIIDLLSLNKKITARGEWYRHLPFGDPKRLRMVHQQTYAIVQDAIDRFGQNGGADLPLSEAGTKSACVLDCLLRAVDERGEKMPLPSVLGNVVIVTSAGFTTTSSLLSWLIYSLVTYTGTQDCLLQELVNYDISDDIAWTPELSSSVPYLNNFVRETQRLHNPAYQPGRTTKTEAVLPGGYRLPPDSVVIPAIYSIHTNSDLWCDPQKFDPDRWDTKAVENRHKYAYVPFAAGGRGCIGFNFALQEVKILLAELVYRYEFVREGKEAVQYDPEFQLVRPLNLYVRAKRRTSWPARTRV